MTCHGDLDFRGTLGIKDDDGNPVPVGFKKIRLVLRLETDESQKEAVEKLVSLSERYCVVLQTIKQGVQVHTSLGHVGKTIPDARKDEHVHQTEEGEGEGLRKTVTNEEVIRLQ